MWLKPVSKQQRWYITSIFMLYRSYFNSQILNTTNTFIISETWPCFAAWYKNVANKLIRDSEINPANPIFVYSSIWYRSKASLGDLHVEYWWIFYNQIDNRPEQFCFLLCSYIDITLPGFKIIRWHSSYPWLRHQMHVFFARRLNTRLNKQPRRRWFETPSRSLWRHCTAQSFSFQCCSI